MRKSTASRAPRNPLPPVVQGTSALAPAQQAPPSSLPLIPEAAIVEALSRKLGSDLEPLEPGEYVVRGKVTVNVDCVVSKGQPTSARQAVRLDPSRLLAAALRLAGVRMDKAANLIERAVQSATAEESPEAPEWLDVIEGTVGRCKSAIADALPMQPREGACKVTGSVVVGDFFRS